MPRNWDDENENEDMYNEEDEIGSQGSRSRSRSPVRSRESGVITGTKARDICNDPDTIDARICVMGLNQSVDKEMIEEYFTQFGKVVAIFVLRNKRNAFVQFEDDEDAKECLNAGDNAQIGDVDAMVKPAKQGGGDSNKQSSQPQQQQMQQKKMLNKGNRNRGGKKNVDFNDPKTSDARVFVDPVNGAITKTDIQDVMEKFGVVLGVQIQSRKDKNMPRYAFVQFRDNNSARNCIRRKNMSIKGYNLMVRSVTSSSNKTEDLPRLSDINVGNRNRPLVLSTESTTSDPMTARARVYVGNIRGDSISKEDLRTFFSNFGIITSVSLHKKKDGKKGFAFVQYSDEEGAQNCLLVGKSVFLHGQQLEIGPVKSEQQNGSNVANLGGGGGGGGGISPWDMQGPFESSGNSFGGLNSLMNMSSPSFSNSGMGIGQNLSNMSLSPNPSMNMLDPTRPNDAEIVVASVAQRSYAEFVESQLLAMNLKVDMIFPPPGISTTKIIMDLIKRKCLFAVMITEENELRRSVTLHVLQGPLQAHCNIPISNALRLIEENFTEYIQVSRRPVMGGGGSGGGGMMSMGQGMLGGPNSAPGSLFGSPPSNFSDSRGMGNRGNAGNGLLGPVPNDGSGLMGPAPVLGGSGVGPQAADMGGMYSLVLDSVKMARELRSVKGEMDVKEIMQGRDFQERVAALKAKANAVKHTMMGGGGGGPSRLGGRLF
ncbi:uncharacterized protein [Palaemon carinicauda]|uniref:uncharacterized protein n=1 Tax=Palaemon carinicauda TaxID=392227 RepID=UPI0035B5F12C